MAFQKDRRLRRGPDIQTVLRRGRTVSNTLATLRFIRRLGGPSRFAFIVSREVSKKSSSRNLIRRRASELIRKHSNELASGYDAVFIFKKGITALSRKNFYRALEELLQRTPFL